MRDKRYKKGYQRGRDLSSLTIARVFADSDKPRWWQALHAYAPVLIRAHWMFGWHGQGFVDGMSDGVRLAQMGGGE